MQCVALQQGLYGVQQNITHVQTEMGHTSVEHLNKRLRDHLRQHVMKVQKGMTLGGKRSWCEVEVDECTFAKHLAEGGAAVEWWQYIGMMERGRPETLMLIQLPIRQTKPRAPGPGPLRKKDWRPIALQHLAGRHILLHSDSARAYDMEIDDVIHDKVIHASKK
eukprot:4485909-Amphidinium_carterae.1